VAARSAAPPAGHHPPGGQDSPRLAGGQARHTRVHPGCDGQGPLLAGHRIGRRCVV
jgi:hypothetical protein